MSRLGPGWRGPLRPQAGRLAQAPGPFPAQQEKGRVLGDTCHGELPRARKVMEEYGFLNKKQQHTHTRRGQRQVLLPSRRRAARGLFAPSPSLPSPDETAAARGAPSPKPRRGRPSPGTAQPAGTARGARGPGQGSSCSVQPGFAFPYSHRQRLDTERSWSGVRWGGGVGGPSGVVAQAAQAAPAPGCSERAPRNTLPRPGSVPGVDLGLGGRRRPLPRSPAPRGCSARARRSQVGAQPWLGFLADVERVNGR